MKRFLSITVFITGLFGIGNASAQQNRSDLDLFNRSKNSVLKFRNINLDSSAVYVDSCFLAASHLNDWYLFAESYGMRSHDYFMTSQLDSALEYAKKSIAIFQLYPDSSTYYIAEYNLGNIYLAREDHIQALVQFKKVLRIVDENFEVLSLDGEEKIDLNRAYCFVSIGMVYSYLGDNERVLSNMQKGLKIASNVNSKESLILQAITLGNLGLAYCELGNYEQAESYAISGLELKKQLGMENSDGYNYNVLAKSAYGRKKYPLCLKYLQLSDVAFDKSHNTDELNSNQLIRARCLIAQKKHDLALEILQQVERGFDGPGTRKERVELYELMSEIYDRNNEYKKSIECLRIALLLEKEELSKSSMDAIEEFILFFELEENRINDKLENYKTLQEKEKLELSIETEREKQVWVYSLFVVSTICFILIIIVIARGNRRSKKINQELNYSIDEKQILFKEVHHRVKNNFQIISSLLNLQQGIEEDERSKKVLTDAQGRIQSMALVHEMLYRKNEVKRIDFKTYANELVASIIRSFNNGYSDITFEISCNNESFDLELAVPLGLILNEAVTNSVKYAFIGKKEGLIKVNLTPVDAKNFRLIIWDDGVGIPVEFINGSKETLGIELINILSQQLGGASQFKNESGTKIEVIFNAID